MRGRRVGAQSSEDRAKDERRWRMMPSVVLTLLVLMLAGVSTWLLFAGSPLKSAPASAEAAVPTEAVPTLPPDTSGRNTPIWIGVMGEGSNGNSSASALNPPLHKAWNVRLSGDAATEQETAISVVGNRLLVSKPDRMLLYEAKTGTLLRDITPEQPVAAGTRNLTTLSPDGRYIYYATDRLRDNLSYSGCCSQTNQPTFGLVAYDIEAGHNVWRYETGPNTVFVQTYYGDLVISYTANDSTSNGALEVVNPTTGRQRWQKIYGSSMSVKAKLAISKYTVVAYLSDGKLVAHDLYSGRSLWQIYVPDGHRLMADQTNVFLTQKHGLEVFFANDGSRDEAASFVDEQSSDEYVEVANDYGSTYVAAATGLENKSNRLTRIWNGRQRWISSFQEMPRSMAVSNDHIYMVASGNGHNHLLGFRRSDGKEVWRSADLPSGEGVSISRPVVAGSMLYIVAADTIYAYAGVQQPAAQLTTQP